MNSTLENGWTARRWAGAIGTAFAVQVMLVVLFGRGTPVSPPGERVLGFRLVGEEMKTTSAALLAGDPAVFVLASSKGFSGQAWLRAPQRTYELPEWSEPPRLLNIDPSALGQTFSNAAAATAAVRFELAEKGLPQPGASEILASLEPARNPSSMRIDGGLPLLNSAPVELPSWPFAGPLPASVIQIGVVGAGGVVSARLLERSGLAEADQAALRIARELLFEPGGPAAADLTWGKVTFHWQTVAPQPSEMAAESVSPASNNVSR